VLRPENFSKIYKVFGYKGEFINKYRLDEDGTLRNVSDGEIIEERYSLWEIVNLFKFTEVK